MRLKNKDSGKIRHLLEKNKVPYYLDINHGYYMGHDKKDTADNALVLRDYSIGFGDPVDVTDAILTTYEKNLEESLAAVREIKKLLAEKVIGV